MGVINKRDTDYIRGLVNNGGPVDSEYIELNNFFVRLGDFARAGTADRKEINHELWRLLGDAVSLNTMQGQVVTKRHGYAGDYELIDNFYTKWISPEPHLENWDYFFHSQSAAIAVRNRKTYFIELLKGIENNYMNGSKVLNVGSGPGRDVAEFFSIAKSGSVRFDCVDLDPNAISYSQNMCRKYSELTSFYCKNVFRYKPKISYDLVWSAGLFDYLDDKRFVFLLKHLCSMVKTGGRLVIGNFSTHNPSRDYIEAGGWFLLHRSEVELYSLAKKSGVTENNISIKSEPERVNLFMHITV